MSEKIYVLLLRLHSARFREEYGDEAVQLFRDRARDERGFFGRLRLWLDLLTDLAISIPRGYREMQPRLAGSPNPWQADGIPSFRLLGHEKPSQRALLLGGVLSFGALLAVPLSIRRGDDRQPPRSSVLEHEHVAGKRLAPPPQLAQRGAASNQLLQIGAVSNKAETRLDDAERRKVIQAVIANLNDHYVDPGAARKVTEALLAHEKNGDYTSVTGDPAFADLLTRQIRDVSQDRQLDVVYSQAPLPIRTAAPAPEEQARYRQAMERDNCTFEKVLILPRNIGYWKLNSFPDPSVCEAAARASMSSLNAADAIIFDLRDNRGGYPEMVMLIASYLFDHPVYMYNPRENTTRLSWTQSPVGGNKLADKPTYVLISARTISGAEQFSFNLKMLKRATLVGETTGGSAHAGVFHRIDEHYGIGIRETNPINPYSRSGWEGTGVEPDVKVGEASALERARKLAESRLAEVEDHAQAASVYRILRCKKISNYSFG